MGKKKGGFRIILCTLLFWTYINSCLRMHISN